MGDPRPSLTELQLLGVLVHAWDVDGRVLTGVEVRERYAARHGRDLTSGTLYTTLTRMIAKGLAVVVPSPDFEDRRVVYYTRTTLGLRAFRTEAPYAPPSPDTVSRKKPR